MGLCRVRSSAITTQYTTFILVIRLKRHPQQSQNGCGMFHFFAIVFSQVMKGSWSNCMLVFKQAIRWHFHHHKPQYISLKPLLRDFGSEGIENFDKVEKPILWFKGLRRRHVALFGFVLVVNLLNLPSIDAQNTGR